MTLLTMKLVLIIVFAFAVCYPNLLFSQTVIWSENWDRDNWTDDWGAECAWEVNAPTFGPDTVVSVPNCIGTNIDGNYSEGSDCRLYRHKSFDVPESAQNPRLRFWHWYSFNAADYGYVEIRIVGEDDWQTLFSNYSWESSGVWSCASVDLSAYENQRVQIGFRFASANDFGNGSGVDVGPGWYIDDVQFVTGHNSFPGFENFEEGIGDWAAERGTWQVGEPQNGPSNSYSGTFCAGTALDRNYSENVNSRLISPEFEIPADSQNPRLRFWHWYSFNAADYGYVEIRIVGEDDWQTLFSNYSWESSGVWSCASVDLSAYENQRVQIGFRFASANDFGNGSGVDVRPGWYIDDVQFVTGHNSFPGFENFEEGIGDWAAERGTWQVGEAVPPPITPSDLPSPTTCAATVLSGKYYEPVDSRLITPFIKLYGEAYEISLQFWHWFSFSAADYGQVEIRTPASDWKTLSNKKYIGSGSDAFAPETLPLFNYADSTVQFGFRFISANDFGNGSGNDVDFGWYIDDVKVLGIDPSWVNLSADRDSGNSPLTVIFSAVAFFPNDPISKYEWDFDGDGTIDRTENTNAESIETTYTYDIAGYYNATITAFNASGDSVSDSKGILVNEPIERTLSIPDTTIQASIGDTVSIPIYISDALSVAGGSIKLRYDESVIKALRAQATDLTSDFLIEYIENNGEISISLAHAKGLDSGSGAFINLFFEVKSVGAFSDVVFLDALLYDENGRPIYAKTVDGNVTILDGGLLIINPPSDTLASNQTQEFAGLLKNNGSFTPADAAWQIIDGFGGPIGSLSTAQGAATILTTTAPGDALLRATFNGQDATAQIVVGDIKGQVDLVDDVDVRDCILTLRYVAEIIPLSPYQLWAADFDGSGIVTSEFLDDGVTAGDGLLILRESVNNLMSDELAKLLFASAFSQFEKTDNNSDNLVSVTVSAMDRQDIYAGKIIIHYNSNELELLSAKPATKALWIVNTNQAGKLVVAMANTSSLVGAGGELAHLEFMVNTDWEDSPDVSATSSDLYDENAHSIEAKLAVKVREPLAIPDQFALHQNYPNPFNPSTTIRFDLPEGDHVKLMIYNINGQLVKTLVDAKLEAGQHEVTWDALDRPSGSYLCRMVVAESGFQSTIRMVLMK